ncbi:MAG: hypothetical protein JEY94_00075 [Melioribacteraceae bacterium]|nr:hypothetical protein [Melioribacteraceae bacterium]
MSILKFCSILLLSLFIISCSSDDGKPNEPIYNITTNQPDELDLRESGIVTSVKDQGAYGTCWSFAVNGMIESMIKREYGEEVDLSEQFLINSVYEMGPYAGLELIKTKGIISEEKLPYKGSKDESYNFTGKCDYKISEFDQIPIGDLTTAERLDYIKSLILEHGPVVTHMTMFRDLDYYKRGVYVYDGKAAAVYGHIILIVGWKNDSSVKNGGYWIIKNSWGTGWGESGFFRIAYDEAETALYYVCTAENIAKIN